MCLRVNRRRLGSADCLAHLHAAGIAARALDDTAILLEKPVPVQRIPGFGGGLGSVHGAFLGAMFLIGMPQLISASKDVLPDAIGQAPGLKAVVYGAVLIAFVLFEPMGLYGRWLKIRTFFTIFPFYRKGMFKGQKSFQKSDRLR